MKRDDNGNAVSLDEFPALRTDRLVLRDIAEDDAEFWLREMTLHRIQVRTDPRNIPSMRLVEGLVFKFEGILREDRFFRGQWIDDACYSTLSWEWKRPQQVSRFG